MSQEGKDNLIKEIGQYVINAYEQMFKLHNCSMHQLMDKLTEQLEEKGKGQLGKDAKS